MVKFTIVFLAVLLNMSVYSRGNEYTGSLTDKQVKIEQQQKEIEDLKTELACKEADIRELQKMNTNEAGIDASVIIYVLLFSAVAGLVSGSAIKRKTESLCRCRMKRKMILKQATCIK